MSNEIEICRLMNVISITQKELDQKEKLTHELADKVKNSDEPLAIHDTANAKIKEKQRLVEQLNNELYEKDKTIEKLQKLLRAKQAEERERQFLLEQGRESVGSEQEERKGPTKITKRKEPRMADGGKRFADGPNIDYEGLGQGREIYGSKKASDQPRNVDKLPRKIY